MNSRISGSWTRLAFTQQSCLRQESSLTCLYKASQAQFITTHNVPGTKSGHTKPPFAMRIYLNYEDHIPTKGLKSHNHVILSHFWLYAAQVHSKEL